MSAIHHRYTTIVHEAIQKHFGMMDKIIGDRIFAVWNVPRRCPRSELRAVQCALDIVSRYNNDRLRDRYYSIGTGLVEEDELKFGITYLLLIIFYSTFSIENQNVLVRSQNILFFK